MTFSILFLLLIQAQEPEATQLPKALQRMIDKKYPKSDLVACAYGSLRQKRGSTFIQGDFNDDAKPDYVAIVHVDAPPPNCFCAVFLSSGSRHVMKVLTEPYMYCSPERALFLDRKGSGKFNYNTQSDTVLSRDAFTITSEGCQTFVYYRSSFSSFPSCD